MLARCASAATFEIDWSELIDYSRVLAGGQRQNHDLLLDEERSRAPLISISARTLVMHGTADPMIPIKHGEALAQEIAGSRLLRLEGAGHAVDPADWDAVVEAILDHT